MKLQIAALVAALVTNASATDKPTAAQVQKAQIKIIEQMERDYPTVKPPKIMWLPCDEENGYYTGDTIVLCTEDLEYPGWAIQVAAHEFGHAVTDQLMDITDENAADEISIVAMGKHRWFDEMLGAAMYMRDHWEPRHQSGDPHPGGAFRAWEMACAEDGAEGRNPDPDCKALYDGLVIKWTMRTLMP